MPNERCRTCDGLETIRDESWWGCGDPDCCGTCPDTPCPECSKEGKRTDFTTEDWT